MKTLLILACLHACSMYDADFVEADLRPPSAKTVYEPCWCDDGEDRFRIGLVEDDYIEDGYLEDGCYVGLDMNDNAWSGD